MFRIILIACLVFVLRFLEILIVRMGTLQTIAKKSKWAAGLDLMDSTLGLLSIAIIVVDRFYAPFSVAFIVGSAVGTFAAAERWPRFVWNLMKSKRNYLKKIPCTTA